MFLFCFFLKWKMFQIVAVSYYRKFVKWLKVVLSRIWSFKHVHNNDGVFFLIEEVFLLKTGIVLALGFIFVCLVGFGAFLPKYATETRGILQEIYFQKDCRRESTLELMFLSSWCLNFALISGSGKKMGHAMILDWKVNEMWDNNNKIIWYVCLYHMYFCYKPKLQTF